MVSSFAEWEQEHYLAGSLRGLREIMNGKADGCSVNAVAIIMVLNQHVPPVTSFHREPGVAILL